MITTPTVDRLLALRLRAMADAYRAQLQDPAMMALSFDERLALLVEAEHLARQHRLLDRRLKEANLRIPQACLEDVRTDGSRGVSGNPIIPGMGSESSPPLLRRRAV